MPHLAKVQDAAISPVIAATEPFDLTTFTNGGLSNDQVSMYRHWRVRILFATIFGYAVFYLVRLNFSVVIPTLQAQYGYSKAELGMVVTTFAIVYGAGKFLNGFLSDRSNARYFMTAGLVGSAIVNLFVGFGESLLFFSICWGISGWFQSMGWPPVARLLTHWYGPKEIGTKWAIWNSSQPLGGAITYVLAAYLVADFGWQSAFYVPAVIALVAAVILFALLRDTPQSLGLPPVEVYKNLVHKDDVKEEVHASSRELLRLVFTSRVVWLVCVANMFLYIIRSSIFTWAPTFLQEMKGSSLVTSSWQTFGLEIAGILGGLAAGYASDRLFNGRRGPVGCIFMGLLALVLFAFWHSPGSVWLDSMAMIAVGFLIYGPQVLVGVAAADFASKKAAGMATGLTGTFGYLGVAISGVGIGYVADNWGWAGGFTFFIGSAILGMLTFALTWTARAKVLDK